MTAQTVQPTYFEVPAITGLEGELLDAATIHEGIDFLEPTALFESYNCMGTDATPIFPCPPVTMAAPVQSASSTSTSGGTLAAGTYRAKITAVNTRGETIASNEQSQVTTGATSTITWNWAAVTGAVTYRVYVTPLPGTTNTEVFLATVTAPTVTLVQTAPVTAGGATPPTVNTAVVPATKTFLTPGWQDGVRFGVYGGINCKGVGNSMEHEQSELERVYLAGESTGVEKGLMTLRLATVAATDLTPAGGAVSPQSGLALLEGFASYNYAGVPTIHAPRTVGSLLGMNNQISKVGHAFFTFQGSKFASGSGYDLANVSPTGTNPAAGEKWMYASGEVVIARGDLIQQISLNQSTNEMFALIERLYVAAVDCFTAAVRVKVY